MTSQPDQELPQQPDRIARRDQRIKIATAAGSAALGGAARALVEWLLQHLNSN